MTSAGIATVALGAIAAAQQASPIDQYIVTFRRLAAQERTASLKVYLLQSAAFFECMKDQIKNARDLVCRVPVPPAVYSGPRPDGRGGISGALVDQSGDFRDCSNVPCADPPGAVAGSGVPGVLEPTRQYAKPWPVAPRPFGDAPAPPAGSTDSARRAAAPSQNGPPDFTDVPVEGGLDLRWRGAAPGRAGSAGEWSAQVEIVNDNEFSVDVTWTAFVLCGDGSQLRISWRQHVRYFGSALSVNPVASPCPNGYPPSPDARVTIRYTATQRVYTRR